MRAMADGTESTGRLRFPMRRLAASVLDLPVVIGWAVLAGGLALGLGSIGVSLENPLAQDSLAFLSLILPVTITFALLEASPRQATPGKRRLGLMVIDQKGQRITLTRSLARSALKFAPWQMAHTAVFRLIADSTDTSYIILSVVAQAIVLGSIASMTLDRHHRSFHDLVGCTRVVDREQQADAVERRANHLLRES